MIPEPYNNPTAFMAEPLPAVRACDVVPERIEWIRPGYLAKGKVSLLDGDPGVGKSCLTIAMAAELTRTGKAVVMLALEDGLADTIVPRLAAAGADRSLVYVEDLSGTEGAAVLPGDIPRIEALVCLHGAALVVVDPVLAYVDGKLNAHHDQAARQAISPLAAMADRTGCAVLLVRHLNKSAGGSALYRGAASIAFAGVARLVLLAGKDPDRPGAFVLAPVKNSLGKLPASLCYVIGERDGAAVIEWGDVSQHGADALVAPADPEDRGAVDEAADFLRVALAERDRPVKELLSEAKEAGIAEKSLRMAKGRAGVTPQKDGMRGGWVWTLDRKREDGQGAPISPGVPSSAPQPTLTPHTHYEDGEDGHGAEMGAGSAIFEDGKDGPKVAEDAQGGKVDGVGHLRPLTDVEAAALAHVQAHPGVPVVDVAQAVHRPVRETERHLRILVGRGLVESFNGPGNVVAWRARP